MVWKGGKKKSKAKADNRLNALAAQYALIVL